MSDCMDRRGFLGKAAMAAAAGTAAGAMAGVGAAAGAGVAAASEASLTPWDEEHDVVVIGAGAAGFMAALAAAELGADAVLLEKTAAVGGDSIVSEQAILGLWPRKRMEVDGQEDDVDTFFADWEKSHKWSNRGLNGEGLPAEYRHARRLIENCPDMYEWLDANCQIEWMPGQLSSLAVMPQPIWDTIPRSWIVLNGLIPQLSGLADGMGLPVLTEHEARSLIIEDGRVAGVLVVLGDGTYKNIAARNGVVIATGTFCANPAMLDKYFKLPSNVFSGGRKSLTGDGHRMAQDAGAALVDMDLGLCWVTYESGVDGWNYGNFMHFYGGPAGNIPSIMINYEGKRFCSESDGYKIVGGSIVRQKCSRAWCVFDSTGDIPSTFFINEGSMPVVADTLDELAVMMQVPPEVFAAEIEAYNAAVEAGVDEDFGKQLEGCTPIATAPFYAVLIEPRAGMTFGGIDTDVDSRVLDTEGNPIPGLYAAGFCTGSYAEQDGLYYLGGLSQALVFGRQAGQMAAEAR